MHVRAHGEHKHRFANPLWGRKALFDKPLKLILYASERQWAGEGEKRREEVD